MTTIAQALTILKAAPMPVLFLDTCALLDIVRAPMRDLTATVRAAVELRKLEAAGKIRLFVQDIVRGEWADNLPSARRDGDTGVRAFTATWQIAIDLGKPAPPLPIVQPGTLINDLESLSKDLLMAADTLDRDHAGMSWAIDCVVAKRKPSSPKGALKDSYILGHALELSKQLLQGKYSKKRLLVSSNRSDFAAPNATGFHQDISSVALAVGLGYAVSLEAAVADLRQAKQI